MRTFAGEVSEWPKEHDWKSCIRQKRIEGSNPSLSAINYGDAIGPRALLDCEPRQIRKEAAAAVAAGDAMWRVAVTSTILFDEFNA